MDEFYKKYPTEEAFISAYPDFAKKMKMGGTPKAFPQTATMDNFFSYGVPTPPTYHQKGGSPGPNPDFGPFNQTPPSSWDTTYYHMNYNTYKEDPDFAAKEYLRTLKGGIELTNPDGSLKEEALKLYYMTRNSSRDALEDSSIEDVNRATVNATLNVLKKHGGATGLPNMYPQIQSEAQFFSPVYSNSPNPYNKAEGGVAEAFPQAIPYDNPTTGNAFGFMQEGGQPETIGVQNRIGNFMNKVANTATSVKNKELLSKFKAFAKHNGYQLGGPTKIEGITEENSISMPTWDTGNTVPAAQSIFGEPQEMGIPSDIESILTSDVSPMVEKTKDKKKMDPTGLAKFYRNQAFKSMAASALNTGQEFDNVGMTTRAFEMINPRLGIEKGTMNPQDGNIFYDKTYSVSDNFAPQYRQFGGGVNEGDVVTWDEETIKQFLAAGGEIEYLD